MPYITQEERYNMSSTIKAITENPPQNAGQLQYLIACTIKAMDPKRYQDMNDIMGALTGANSEFYSMVVAPYEDNKMMENGPVYFAHGQAMSREYDPNTYQITSKGYGEEQVFEVVNVVNNELLKEGY